MAEELKKTLEIDATGAKASIDGVNKELDKTNEKTDEVGKKSKTNWAMFTTGVLATVAALKAAYSAVSKWMQEDARQERILRQGNFLFGERSKALWELSGAIENATGSEAEHNFELMQMAKTMGAADKNIERIIKGAIGLQTALGVDAASATKMLTLAIEEGEYSMISRYIPALRGVEDETEKQRILNETLAKSWGMATDNINTSEGATKKMWHAIGTLTDSIGKLLNTALLPLIKGITWYVDIISGAADETERLAKAEAEREKARIVADIKDMPRKKRMEDLRLAQIKLMEDFEALMKAEEEEAKSLEGVMKKVEEFDKARAKTSETVLEAKDITVESANAEIAKIKEIELAYEDLKDVIIDTTVSEAEQWDLRLSKVQDFFNKYGEAINQSFSLGTQFNEMEMQDLNNKYSTQQEALDQKFARGLLSQEQYDQQLKKLELQKEKEAKKIHQRQQKIDIGMAVANTAVAITNALRTEPFLPLGPIMAGLAATAGAVQIATIAKQKLAKGGYVFGSGTATSDSIDAKLSNGEFVNTARTVQALPNTVAAIDNFQRTGSMPNIARAAALDTGRGGGGGGTTVIQPKATASVMIKGRDLAVIVQQQINQMRREGADLEAM
jgi:hypothetical protein